MLSFCSASDKQKLQTRDIRRQDKKISFNNRSTTDTSDLSVLQNNKLSGHHNYDEAAQDMKKWLMKVT